jgi:MoaA/NifB/PqqE/SkfB family radical SAM enzyme
MSQLKRFSSFLKSFILYYYYVLFGRLFKLKPRKLLLALTYQCNSRCIMCNIWQMPKLRELSLKEWKILVRDPFLSNLRSLDLTGGEALLHPEFSVILSLFINNLPKLKKISLVTNGFISKSGFKKIEKIVKLCQEKEINLIISVSLDDYADGHQKIRGVSRAFDRVKLSLKKIRDLEKQYSCLSLFVGVLLMRQNLRTVKRLTHWLEKHAYQYTWQIVGFHDTYVRNLDTEDKVNFRSQDWPLLIRFLKKIAKPKHFLDFNAYYWADILSMYSKKTNRSTPCPFLVDSVVIDAYGQLYWCFSSQPIGQVFDQKTTKLSKTLSEVFFKASNFKKRQQMRKEDCLHCNSSCNTYEAIRDQAFKFIYFRLTGKVFGS